jgi:hypothetical protein
VIRQYVEQQAGMDEDEDAPPPRSKKVEVSAKPRVKKVRLTPGRLTPPTKSE